jgi:hypothetical protein
MGNKPDMPSYNYSPICRRISEIADRTPWMVRRSHGIMVGDEAVRYFQLLAKRVKPGPDLNGTKALTIALARIHHLRGHGGEKAARERFCQALERGTGEPGKFQEELGMPRDEFIGLLRRYVVQYGSLHSGTLDFNENSGLLTYAAEINKGGLSLPTLLVRIADLSLDFEDGIKGLPKSEQLSDHNKQLLARKLRLVYFPFADMLGWAEIANRLRHNSLFWDDNRRSALFEKQAWLEERYEDYKEAGDVFRILIEEMLNLLSRNPEFSKYSEILQSAKVQKARVKTPSSIVLKEEKSSEIKDIVALRVVFKCTPKDAQLLGEKISNELKKMRRFGDVKIQDNITDPKPTGYRAMHTTGLFEHKDIVVPIEVQFMDEEAHYDSLIGRSSRLVYKSGRTAGHIEIIDAINNILAPVFGAFVAAVTDTRGPIEPAVPVSIRKRTGGQTRTFTVQLNGSDMKFRERTDSTVADLAVLAMDGPINVSAFDSSNGGRPLSLFDKCPNSIRLVPKGGNFNRGVVSRLLNSRNVSQRTKKIVRAHLNSS